MPTHLYNGSDNIIMSFDVRAYMNSDIADKNITAVAFTGRWLIKKWRGKVSDREYCDLHLEIEFTEVCSTWFGKKKIKHNIFFDESDFEVVEVQECNGKANN